MIARNLFIGANLPDLIKRAEHSWKFIDVLPLISSMFCSIKCDCHSPCIRGIDIS